MAIGVSIIGCGGIAQVHLEALAALRDEAVLVAAVDIRPEAARETATKWGVRRHGTDLADALGPDTDAVFVCVPTHLHSELAVAALQAGKHLFCEKPLARTLPQAQAILEAYRPERQAAVGFVRRYDEEWLAFRDKVQAGAVGSPVVWQDAVSGVGPPAPWFSQDEEGGGPFLDGAIHTMDFALWTFGPAEWVFTNGRTLKATGTAIDTGTSTIRFASGDELMLAWSWGLPPGVSGARVFQFLGPQGLVSWPEGVGAPPLPGTAGDDAEAKSRFRVDTGADTQDVYFPADALSQAYRRQVREFLAAVRGETTPRAGLADGVEALRLALAVLESARTEQVVRLS